MKRQFIYTIVLVENGFNDECYWRTSPVLDLKLNHELYVADLKMYSQLAQFKNIDELGF